MVNYIIHSKQINPGIKIAIISLQQNLEEVSGEKWEIKILDSLDATSLLREKNQAVLVGLKRENQFHEESIISKDLKRISGEGYLIKTIRQNGTGKVILAGAQVRGLIYAIFDYSENILKVDPYRFWSERKPDQQPGFHFPSYNRIVASPLFNYRIWMDDDSDELLNYKGNKLEYDRATWKGVVETLLRTGYNGIWLCDTLGRGEFYMDCPWFGDYYKRIHQNYQTNLELIEWLIDYGHERGILIGTSLFFTEFNHLKPEQSHWEQNKDAYIQVWKDYMTKYPTRKADLYFMFSLGMYLDGCPFCGDASPGVIAQEQINIINQLIKEYKPEAKVLYSIIRSQVNADELDFPDSFIPCVGVVKKEAPYVDPDVLEKIKEKRIPSGIFTHACLGTHYQHLIHSPDPEKISQEVAKALKAGATEALILDGQNLRNFLFNLSAMKEAIWNKDQSISDSYYLDWSKRNFGDSPAANIASNLRLIKMVNDEVYGFTHMVEKFLWRIGLKPQDMEKLETVINYLKEAMVLAQEARGEIAQPDLAFFDSYIMKQTEIFLLMAVLCRDFDKLVKLLESMINPPIELEDFTKLKKTAGKQAEKTLASALTMDKSLRNEPIEKFKNWYLPENQRIFTPPRDLSHYTAIKDFIENIKYDTRIKEWASLMKIIYQRDHDIKEMDSYRKKYKI